MGGGQIISSVPEWLESWSSNESFHDCGLALANMGLFLVM